MRLRLKENFPHSLKFNNPSIAKMLKMLHISRKRCQIYKHEMNSERIKKLRKQKIPEIVKWKELKKEFIYIDEC